MGDTTAIVWFRSDLRLSDHPALRIALDEGGVVIPVFVQAPEEEGAWPPGAASRWWLHQSLEALSADLESRGSRLVIRRGPSVGPQTIRPAGEMDSQTVAGAEGCVAQGGRRARGELPRTDRRPWRGPEPRTRCPGDDLEGALTGVARFSRYRVRYRVRCPGRDPPAVPRRWRCREPRSPPRRLPGIGSRRLPAPCRRTRALSGWRN